MSVESEMKAWGKATYRKFQQYYRQNERGSETASSKRILDRMAPKLAQPVEDFFNRFVQDGSPSMPIWLTFICDLHPQVVAHLGLRAMLNYIVSCNNFNRLAFMIGREYESICRRQVAEETVSKNQMYDVKLQRDRNQRIRKFYKMMNFHLMRYPSLKNLKESSPFLEINMGILFVWSTLVDGAWNFAEAPMF